MPRIGARFLRPLLTFLEKSKKIIMDYCLTVSEKGDKFYNTDSGEKKTQQPGN